METKFSLWQRITSDTPSFFKKAQVFGLGLVSLGAALHEVQGMPAALITTLISAGGAIAAVAQFAVKQCEPINPMSYDDTKSGRTGHD